MSYLLGFALVVSLIANLVLYGELEDRGLR